MDKIIAGVIGFIIGGMGAYIYLRINGFEKKK